MTVKYADSAYADCKCITSQDTEILNLKNAMESENKSPGVSENPKHQLGILKAYNHSLLRSFHGQNLTNGRQIFLNVG